MRPTSARPTIDDVNPRHKERSMAPTPSRNAQVAVGDRLVVRAHFQGQPERDAEILEVLGTDGPPYRVRWEDGRESIIFPGPDVFIEHFPSGRARR
jgi:hypothetical protein